MRISFDFDEKTHKVSNVRVTKTNTEDKPDKIFLSGSSLKLNDEVLSLLKVKEGDRLCVQFNPDPLILTQKAANLPKGGNLVSKSKTLSCRGAVSERLNSLGDAYSYKLVGEGRLALIIDNTDEESTKTDEVAETTSKILDKTDFEDLGLEDIEIITL